MVLNPNRGKGVLFRGHVYYENKEPVANAIAVLEKIVSNSCSTVEFCMYTTTNSNGEFCFEIIDINQYYLVSIHNNISTCEKINSVSIEM